jgi:hypothetical protein
MLDVSRIEAGKLVLDRGEIRVCELLNEACELARRRRA